MLRQSQHHGGPDLLDECRRQAGDPHEDLDVELPVLRQVLRARSRVADRLGRMVGIITHIPELREEFAQQVVVIKHPGFSTVKVHGLSPDHT
jgi:hypothetical protein